MSLRHRVRAFVASHRADLLGAAILALLLLQFELNFGRHFAFAAACTLALFGAFATLTRRIGPALALTTASITAIGVASELKYKYFSLTLQYDDLFYFAGENLRHVLTAYRGILLVAAAALGGLALLLGFAFRLSTSALPRRAGLAIALAGLCLAWTLQPRIPDRARIFLANEDLRHVSTFFLSALDNGGLMSREVVFDDVALPLLAVSAEPAGALPGGRPHVIMILNESVFDPRLLGVPVEPEVDAFLRGRFETVQKLHVETVNGGTWLSEFSSLTGLPVRAFGKDRHYVMSKMAGRVPYNLAAYLGRLGYGTLATYPVRGSYMNGRNFFEKAGFGRFLGSEDYFPQDPSALFFARDSRFFDLQLPYFREAISAGPAFIWIKTMVNHGPHDVSRMSAPDEEAGRAFIRARFGENPELEEYYGRLKLTVADYAAFKARLAREFPDESFLIVHFGDHQPELTAGLAPADDPRRFLTYFAIDAVNFEPDLSRFWPGDTLDVAFLPNVVRRAARLPLDPVLAFREALARRCGADLYGCDDIERRRFHAGLAAAGLMEIDNLPASPAPQPSGRHAALDRERLPER